MSRIRITTTAKEAGSDEPLKEGGRAFRGCLFTLLGGVLGAVVVITPVNWGESIGRTIVTAIGYGVAGVVLPWYCGGEPRTVNQTRFLIAISTIGSLAGIGFGIYKGRTGEDQPFWVYGIAGVAVAIAGALAGRLVHRSVERP